jgi:hypothetical protein
MPCYGDAEIAVSLQRGIKLDPGLPVDRLRNPGFIYGSNEATRVLLVALFLVASLLF